MRRSEHIVTKEARPICTLVRRLAAEVRAGGRRVVNFADNAANAGVITGDTHVNPRDVDLRWAGALFYLNGEIEETGLGAAVMDHPGHGIRWVCKRFAPHGIGLEPGQLILSGSFTRPVIVQAGDHVRVDYGPLGEITLDFV